MGYRISPGTPNHLKVSARVLACPAYGLLWFGMLSARMTQLQLSVMLFFLAAALLMAAPRIRNSEVLGILAIAITISEAVAGHLRGTFDIGRWRDFLAILGAITLILKIQHWRSLARTDRHVSLRHLERRNLFPTWPISVRLRSGNPSVDSTAP